MLQYQKGLSCLVTAKRVVEVGFPTGLSLILQGRSSLRLRRAGSSGSPHCCLPGEEGTHCYQVASTDTEGGVLRAPWGRVPNPHSAFLTPPWGGVTARESQLLALSWPLLVWVRVEPPPPFFLGAFPRVECYHPKVSCLRRLSLFWSSGQRGQVFVGDFWSACAYQCFWVASFFGSKSGICEARKKIKQVTTQSFLGRHGPHRVCLLSNLLESSYVSFYVECPGFLVVCIYF